MHAKYNPPDVAAPASTYSHGVEVKPNARWLYISGQIGVLPNGKVAADFKVQSEACWSNIASILKEAGMGMEDLVKITTFIRNPADIATLRTVRDRFIGDARPASTLVVVAGLASPEWLVEIEAVAAKA